MIQIAFPVSRVLTCTIAQNTKPAQELVQGDFVDDARLRSVHMLPQKAAQ
jgi:hypothetical protein